MNEDIARFGRDISGPDPAAPWIDLGDNTGIQHQFIDTDVSVINEYCYKVFYH